MNLAVVANDLQELSEGRFILGLGSQIKPHITKRYSMPWSHPAPRMREMLLAIRAIWDSWANGTKLDFRGDFYTHTLMTPFFNPGPTGYPPPPILLGGVGADMTAVAGEVADGFICGPLTSRTSFLEHTAAALRRGRAARSGTPAAPFQICAMPLIVTGSDAAMTERVAQATRQRIAFYASTPSYRHILALHGWEELHERLHALSRAGAWAQMADLIDDEVLDAFAVIAEPEDVMAAVHDRFAGQVNRVIVHGALDPGLDVWRGVLAGARTPLPAAEAR